MREFLLHLELALMHDVDISDRIPLCEDDLPTEVLLLAQAPVKVEQARLRVLAEDRDALEELARGFAAARSAGLELQC